MKRYVILYLFITAAAASVLLTSCFEDDGECQSRPIGCNESSALLTGRVIINVTIDPEVTTGSITLKRGASFESGTVVDTYTATPAITKSGLPVDAYSAQCTYTYKGMTITATDSDEITVDSDDYCEGPCYETVDADIDLNFDKTEFDKYIGGEDDNCFIATAAFGTKLAPEVQTLRNFRDTYLLTNTPGKIFTSAYYRLSPPAASVISSNETLRAVARWILYPIIFTVKNPGAGLALFLAVVAAPSGLRKIFILFRRKK